MNPIRLRAQAAFDTKGLTRGSRIKSQKAAGSMYEAMCSMADNSRPPGPISAGSVEVGSPSPMGSRRSPGQPQDGSRGAVAAPGPRLLEEPGAGPATRPRRQAAATDPAAAAGRGDRLLRHRPSHGGVLRYDLGVEDAGSDDRILSRLSEIGRQRLAADASGSTARARPPNSAGAPRLPDEESE